MEKKGDLFMTNLARNIEEWVTVDARGITHSTYQKRILGAEAGG
jgi:hypothetical protein